MSFCSVRLLLRSSRRYMWLIYRAHSYHQDASTHQRRGEQQLNQGETSMKTSLAILVFASLVATSAVAKIEKGQTTHFDRSDTYQSDSLGHQSFPNPDQYFSIENLRPHKHYPRRMTISKPVNREDHSQRLPNSQGHRSRGNHADVTTGVPR